MAGHRVPGLFLLAGLCSFIFFASLMTSSSATTDLVDKNGEDAMEIVVRIPAEEASTKMAVVDALLELGHGTDCPKADRPYVDAKVPIRLVPHLRQSLAKVSSSLAMNMTVVEDPVRAEYERFVREQRRLHAERRQKRSVEGEDSAEEEELADKRDDPLTNLYNKYHSQADLEAFLHAIASRYPHIARIYTIGKTSKETPLWAIQISDNPGQNEVGEVEFLYIANMHGDEVVGRQLSIYFIYHLCSNYDTDPTVKALIDNMNIHILPTMNPDGFDRGRRANSNGYDLNRNFPDQFSRQTWLGSAPLPPLAQGDGSVPPQQENSNAYQSETLAVMKWMASHNFALAANFHGGSVVANYPFDGNRRQISGQYAASPDDDIYRQLAREYAANNPTMANSQEFPGGVTNGAGWYVLYGGMQDYSYLWHGAMHVTIELSDEKWPNPRQLTSFWNDNHQSMLAYMDSAKYRVWGVVTDCSTNLAITKGYVMLDCGANCFRPASKIDTTTGDYHRLVPRPVDSNPVSYTLKVTAPGYQEATRTFSVSTNVPLPLRVDVCLQRS